MFCGVRGVLGYTDLLNLPYLWAIMFSLRALNMSEFVCDRSARPYVYDLIAVSNHYGAMGVGHCKYWHLLPSEVWKELAQESFL